MSRPRVRTARYGDIPAVYEMMVEMLEASRYAGASHDERRAKGLLMTAIQRHGGDKAGATFLAVADTGERLEGFILGVLSPLYQVLDRLEATDLFWFARKGAHPDTARRLLRAMHAWAPADAVIRQGTTDAITDPGRSGRLLKRTGMRLAGSIYEKDKP